MAKKSKYHPGEIYVPEAGVMGSCVLIADKKGVLKDMEGNLAPTNENYRRLPKVEKIALANMSRKEGKRQIDLADFLEEHT